MANKIHRLAPTGNMDKDTDLRYVGKGDRAGDYLDARNIQSVDGEENIEGSVPPTLGNEFAFDLGSVSQQNKRYRITFDGDATKQHEVRFLSTQRDANMVVGTGPNEELQFNGTVLDFLSAFNAAISGSGVLWSIQVNPSTPNVVDIELASYPMYQWFLESTGPDVIDVVCVAEAIPVDLAGPLKDIGSYDLLGDLFVFSTTQDNEPTAITPTIILVGPTSGGSPNTYLGPLTSILFNGEHGLVQGQWIRITGSNEAFLNGLFVVHSIVDPQTVRIVTSTAWGVTPTVTTLGTPQVFIHPSGIGEIGVAQKDDNTDTWTYTRLLRSVELNFVSKWQIDSFAERGIDNITAYYTDNYNRPRLFYYKGDYVLDGALEDPNIYQYGSIARETSIELQARPVNIELIEQFSSGGNIVPGTKFYGMIQLTATGNRGPISPLMGPVVMYKHGLSPDIVDIATEIGGLSNDDVANNSLRRNKLRISGLDRDVYQRGNLFVIELIGGSISAKVIYDFSIPESGDLEYTHTGFEEGELIDVAEITASYLFQMSTILKAKNIRQIDGRAVLSNLKTVESLDMSKWAESIRHELYYDTYDEATLKDLGEMQDSFNTNEKLGLMLNETYRLSTRAYITGVGWTPWYWVDDIKVDANPVNTANPTSNRRISALPDYELVTGAIEPLSAFEVDPNARVLNGQFINTSGVLSNGYTGIRCLRNNSGWTHYFDTSNDIYDATATYKIPKVRFHVEWDFYFSEIGGNLSDLVSGIEFGIGDVPNHIKASGYGIKTCQGDQAVQPQNGYIGYNMFEFPFHPFNKTKAFTSEPNIASSALIPNYPIVAGTSPSTAPYEYPIVDDVCSFYSPEQIIGGNGAVSSSRKLLYFGSALTYKCLSAAPGASSSVEAYFSIFHPQGIDYGSVFELDIAETAFLSDAVPSATFNNGYPIERVDSVENIKTQIAPDVYERNLRKNDQLFILLNGSLPPASETEIRKQDRGVFYGQLYEDVSLAYPEKENTFYRKIGRTFSFELNQQPTSFDVDGGDTATSLFYFNHRCAARPAPSSPTIWDASLIGMVCQTRVNVKALDTFESQADRKTYPYDYSYVVASFSDSSQEKTSLIEWATMGDATLPVTNIYEFNIDYDLNPVVVNALWPSFRYGLNLSTLNDFPARIRWSERKLLNSIIDDYRIFLPLNIKDLDLTFGEIFHHENVNGELFTLQPRKWQRQLFNTRGELQVEGNATGVIIGDASVLSRDGQTLSRYGTQNKWSCILGASDGGKDTLYWYNAENGLFMRFGADGTVVISERARFRSFANRAAKWLRGKDTPAFEQGIRAVWDDRSKEVIWTFTGWRTVAPWQNSGQFLVQSTVGTVVANPNAPSDTYENLPRFFRCTVAHTNSSSREPGVGADWQDFWEQIAYDDFEYYSVFTVALNETTNGFRTFYGHIPKTYLKWRDTFLSSHPTQRNLIFEHRRGEPTTWYGKADAGIAPKIEDAHIEMVLNEMPEQTMRGVAVRYLSDSVPDRIDYTTRRHRTFDTAATLTQVDDYYTGPIRNDITTTGNPDSDGPPLSGDYLRIKFTIFGGTYNLLHSMVVKVFDRLRRVNK